MLCKMASGGLVKIRVDMLSERPHSMSNYSLQGTKGSYESARSKGERPKVWLESVCEDANSWMDLMDLEAEHMPEIWRNPTEAAQRAGHGGGDYGLMQAFVAAVAAKDPGRILSGPQETLETHLSVFAAERSRREGTVVSV